MTPVRIPRLVDEPPPMLLWTVDELMPFFIFFVIGFLIGQVLICSVIGFVLVRFFRRYKDSQPDGFLMHALWWHGIGRNKGRTIGNPFQRDFNR